MQHLDTLAVTMREPDLSRLAYNPSKDPLMLTTKPRPSPPRVDPGTVNRLLDLAAGRDDAGLAAAADAVRAALLADTAARRSLITASSRVHELHAAGTLWDAKPMATAIARRSTANTRACSVAAAARSAVAALRSALTRVAVNAANVAR